jgi:hypothetical protein
VTRTALSAALAVAVACGGCANGALAVAQVYVTMTGQRIELGSELWRVREDVR